MAARSRPTRWQSVSARRHADQEKRRSGGRIESLRESEYEILIDHYVIGIAPVGDPAQVAVEIVPAPDGQPKANLWATIGPQKDGGIVRSGHTDVVPVEGQAWTTDPFRLTRRDNRLLGRGAADMKGFIACAIEALVSAKDQDLAGRCMSPSPMTRRSAASACGRCCRRSLQRESSRNGC